MPKFCTQCGSPLSDDAAFCNSCGAKVGSVEEKTVENTPISEEVTEVKAETTVETENANPEVKPAEASVEEKEQTSQPVENTAPAQEPTSDSTPLDKGIAFAKDKVGDKYEAFKTSPNRDKYIGFAAIGIVAIVIIIVALSIIFSGGYKGVVKDYMKYYAKGDYDSFVEATPNIIYDAILESEYNGDEDDMEDDMENNWDTISSYIKDIDYEISDAEKFSSDQLDDLEDSLQDEYEDYVDKNIKVSKAYEVKVRITTKIKGSDTKNKDKAYLIVAKVNGDWGVVLESSSSQIDDFDD